MTLPRMWRALMIAIWLVHGLVQTAEAKLVAVVFDTSGSMEQRYQLPGFGMKLLAATIDGRVGFDRL